MTQHNNTRPKRACPACHDRYVLVTSASPGDGRRRWVCRNCDHTWTEGKREGEGYGQGVQGNQHEDAAQQ